jgi:transaldolase
MSENRLTALVRAGQSIWYDQMERRLVTQGRLAKMIEEDSLGGLTSNPTIFEKAIGGSADYDGQLRGLAAAGKPAAEIYEAIVVEDIRAAADVFRPVWEATGGKDGYVSLEVSPRAAYDADETAREAKHYVELVGRPNLMVKIPATEEGLSAIEETIASGINVNVTLIFSREVYAKVIEAYLRGLERRAAAGLPLSGIASVASFFVSRIDTKIDALLSKKIESGGDLGELEPLLGKAAIANAKLAYQLFLEIFSSDRFMRLAEKGAAVQRPLWASTSTKNPSYRDVIYVEELIGPDTVNTLPPATFDAFRDHGEVRPSLEENVGDARATLERLAAAGISFDDVTTQLTREGVESFAASFESLLETIESRRAEALQTDEAVR